MGARARKVRRWIIGSVAVLVILAFGGSFIYNQFMAGPAPAMLTLPRDHSGSNVGSRLSMGATTFDGLWTVGTSSLVGFRVPTDALGYRGTVVGRTRKVWGSIMMSGSAVTKGSFTVDMASVTSSASERTILDVGTDPTATFLLTRPINLAGPLASGTVQHSAATGDLSVHGTTRALTITISDERIGSTIYVLADLPITFKAWHIAVPYGVEKSGTLEVLLGLIQDAGNHA